MSRAHWSRLLRHSILPRLSVWRRLPAQAADETLVEIASKNGRAQLRGRTRSITMPSAPKGLMYRKELPEGSGMLFDFQREQDVAFWMQNTYIPLDMIFIRADGRIQRIAENTEPLSHEHRALQRPGPGRAGGHCRHRAQARHRARRPGRASDFQPAGRLWLALAGLRRSVYRPASSRGVAQSGSASGLGAEGRRFKSCRPDQPAPR